MWGAAQRMGTEFARHDRAQRIADFRELRDRVDLFPAPNDLNRWRGDVEVPDVVAQFPKNAQPFAGQRIDARTQFAKGSGDVRVAGEIRLRDRSDVNDTAPIGERDAAPTPAPSSIGPCRAYSPSCGIV